MADPSPSPLPSPPSSSSIPSVGTRREISWKASSSSLFRPPLLPTAYPAPRRTALVSPRTCAPDSASTNFSYGVFVGPEPRKKGPRTVHVLRVTAATLSEDATSDKDALLEASSEVYAPR
ncbi:hypothetical protein KM043_008996 [Ampulex compressa]|nr:hypothetical protein KM043_008996 [Ampulex compressa]